MKIALSILSFFLLAFSVRVKAQYDSLQPQGIYTSNFIINEIPRNLTYYMPLEYGKLDAYSLLIVLHDENSSAINLIKKYGDLLHGKADSTNSVVMYPDAINSHWNSNQDSANDISFISIMLNFFVQQYNCDPSHVYLLGLGSGGNTAARFRCASSAKISALASVATTINNNPLPGCSKKEATSVLQIQSAAGLKPAISQALQFLYKP